MTRNGNSSVTSTRTKRFSVTSVCLNNVVEQDHHGVKRVTRPMLGSKSFEAAQSTLVGIELMHMLKKGQMAVEEGAEKLTPAAQFYAMTA